MKQQFEYEILRVHISLIVSYTIAMAHLQHVAAHNMPWPTDIKWSLGISLLFLLLLSQPISQHSTTYLQPIHNLFTTYSQPIHNLFTTYFTPYFTPSKYDPSND